GRLGALRKGRWYNARSEALHGGARTGRADGRCRRSLDAFRRRRSQARWRAVLTGRDAGRSRDREPGGSAARTRLLGRRTGSRLLRRRRGADVPATWLLGDQVFPRAAFTRSRNSASSRPVVAQTMRSALLPIMSCPAGTNVVCTFVPPFPSGMT